MGAHPPLRQGISLDQANREIADSIAKGEPLRRDARLVGDTFHDQRLTIARSVVAEWEVKNWVGKKDAWVGRTSTTLRHVFANEKPAEAFEKAAHRTTTNEAYSQQRLHDETAAVDAGVEKLRDFTEQLEQTYDVFICHASEDKDDVARPLAEALRRGGAQVWLDELELKIGDSFSRKIDEGLRNSRFGVVILSPSFFKKPWPQRELDGLADREQSSGSKVVLPVWHAVDRDEVTARSPPLAGKHAACTSDGIECVAASILEVLQRST